MTKYVAIVRLEGAPKSNKIFLEAKDISDALELMVEEAKVTSTDDFEGYDLFELDGHGGMIPRAQKLEDKRARTKEIVAAVVNTPVLTVRAHNQEEEYKMYEVEDA